MATFEEDGVIVSDHVSGESPLTTSKSSAKEEEKNASNNSSTSKTAQYNGSKSHKSRANKKQASQNTGDQHVRREEILKEMKGKQYVYSGHTQSFLNALMRPNMDARDIKTKIFKNQLMTSENMDDVPTSFAKNWLMVVCPLGSRCLVIASRGYTGAYTKTGYHIISHPSTLPMGNKMFQGYGPCVLDCIYCNETETYYVLDLMCWDGQALYDCDTQTRFKLLNEKIREHDLGRPSPMNPYPLIPLKAFTPTKNNIHGAVTLAPYVIDGLIFYHKQLTYSPGPTPLMLWMTLDRLPTKMKIEIPEMGIASSISYKDPVALALAHGVSPAIISQVYPAANSQGGHTRNGRGSAVTHGRQMRQGAFSAPPLSHGYEQGGRRMRGGTGAMQDFAVANSFSLLNEMMMNLNLQGTNPGLLGGYGMMPQGRPHQRNFNSNNNNSNGFHYPYRRHSSQNFYKTRQKRKQQQASNRRKNAVKASNWEEPHAVMRSQWMEKKPDDFEKDYLTCICPISKRRIIVAAKGTTCLYNKFGRLIDTYKSSLPNGSGGPLGKPTDELVILDCLWCGSFQKFFVIDVMHWRSQPFYETEAEFRFFWISDKISGITLQAGKREYDLAILPKYPSDEACLSNALTKVDFKIDGLLSFHRKSKYSLEAGASAVWLKLDMLQEVLGYAVPPQVAFKASTEKERKQRAYFMGLNNKSDDKADDESAEQLSNGSGDDDLVSAQ
ncbi:snurportin-1 [Plakobranchus ocellatus]|uniref:Snurportin-1 n=1 Tax=Plakobranchus ocellatus TaxID=259542 RepID=A0AAV3YNW9_9GAST|nr:snurportin-1 [Plakobranchus ocellatus]